MYDCCGKEFFDLEINLILKLTKNLILKCHNTKLYQL
jgi:hypothetical protein